MAGVIEVQDLARVHSLLVVPSPRRQVSAAELAVFNARLAPIEMASPSLHMAFTPKAGTKPSPPTPSEPAPLMGRQLPPYVIPLVYALCGLALGLCNVLVPHGVMACVHLLCPAWTLAVALHALAEHDAEWTWLGGLTILLLPPTLLLHDAYFACFYLLVFAAFGSGRFWRSLHGPPFVLVCVCWFGLATSCVLAVLADHPRAQLGAAVFFALGSAIVSSARFGGLRVAVARLEPVHGG